MNAKEIFEIINYTTIVAAKVLGYKIKIHNTVFVFSKDDRDCIRIFYHELDEEFLITDYDAMETFAADTIEEIEEILIELL